ncbi:MAG: tRNA (N(6)-L-threonylcarbamoyladenosine(37)-C(2))-methylthiotransferase MtaB [Bacteroidia bacterium]|nr:tRNA (N(6)-L-threonylcarbamoyladenosine(37)-C(2))-methylthiotransferase MtaB [Bacteroidia bacterium]
MPAPKVAFHTLGCKLNFTDSGTISRQFESAGYKKVSFDETADVYVINTCSVTGNADRECRSVINKALRKNPDAFIAVTGCFAQLKAGLIAGFKGVDLVAGANDKFKIIEHIHQQKNLKPLVMACDIEQVNEFVPGISDETRTRAFLKVQDGCDYQCSFCTIPLARGKSRSNTIENVLNDARQLIRNGAKEIVLTGVNLGDFHYFKNGQRYSFFDLIKHLDRIDGHVRFRISSIEPNLLSDEIIEFVAASGKFVPHFHIPLQSGSDQILKQMRRRYLSELYASRIRKIKLLMPFACIGADVITGFPGESEEDFQTTYDFIQSHGISYLHVFTYSERDNTHAITLARSVPYIIRKERTLKLRNLSEKLHARFLDLNEGRTLKVLFEHSENNGLMSGYSENYIRISRPYDISKVNQVVELIYSSSSELITA